MQDYEVDRWTQNQKLADDALKFYGDGSKLQEIYGNNVESFDMAASKFHGSNQKAAIGNKDDITLSYDEARKYAYGQ